MSVFSRLHPRLQQAIVARLGWTSLRPVQELAGEALLDGHNAVILAPTAGGKTEANPLDVNDPEMTSWEAASPAIIARKTFQKAFRMSVHDNWLLHEG